MKPELLVTTPIYAPTLAALEDEFAVHKLWRAPDPEIFINEIADRVRAVVTTGIAGITQDRMRALPKLEIISCFGTPNGTVDLAAAKDRGVVVTNTPDSIAAPVADLALGLLIAVMRRICASDRFVRAGKWREGPPPMGIHLGGKTCGIVGLGKVGNGIAQRAQGFGMAVCYHGPRRKEGVNYLYYPDLEALAQAAECLVVACPLTAVTSGVIDARILDALGPEGFLINVARGPIVNQEALITALQEKRIAGAGLDVFWDEPEVPSELIAMENVVLQPHMGSSTREIREERGRKVLANLRAHFAGKPVLTPMGGIQS
jgi:hydroxypyruvate reductase